MQEIPRLREEFKHVFYSAHSPLEVLEAIRLGASYVTLSPIFAKAQKNPPLGAKVFYQIPPPLRKKVFLLGGISTNERLKHLATLYAPLEFNFASITYFLQGELPKHKK